MVPALILPPDYRVLWMKIRPQTLQERFLGLPGSPHKTPHPATGRFRSTSGNGEQGHLNRDEYLSK